LIVEAKIVYQLLCHSMYKENTKFIF
jgi:hypothetical protein